MIFFGGGGYFLPSFLLHDKMEYLELLESVRRTNFLLESLVFVTSMLFGSLLFVHFGRFMRW